MKRFARTALAAVLSVTLSFMCVPAGAISAFASTAASSADEQIANTAASTVTTQSLETSSIDTGDIIDGVFNASYSDAYEYHYTDSYFTKASTTYNEHLATMSLCLALSAFGSHTGTTDKDYANADSNVKDLMGQLGFSDYVCSEDFHKCPTDSSIGAAISHKEITVSDGSTRSVIAIAIRGGNYQQEWSGNATLGKSGEAEGFATARDKVIKLLGDYLDKYSSSITQQPKFWVVGYSRGSAVANLTSNFLNYAMERADGGGDTRTSLMANTAIHMRSLHAKHTDLFGYGFEVPAGASKSSQYICSNNYTNIWNIVDPTDPVPMVAPALWGFYRYGTDVDPTEGVSYDAVRTQVGYISSRALSKWDGLKTNKEGDFKLYDAGLIETCKDFFPNADNYTFTSYKTHSKSFKHDFLQGLINFVAKEMGGEKSGRKNYVENYQPVIKIFTRLMFSDEGGMSDFSSAFVDGLKARASNKKALIGKLVLGTINPFDSVGEEMEKFAVSCVHAGLVKVQETEKARSVLLDGELDTMFAHEDDLGKLVFQFLFDDAYAGGGMSEDFSDGTLIPTAYMYKDELISAHDSDFVLAYMRAKDSNYSKDAAGSYYFTLSDSKDGGSMRNSKVSVIDKDGVEVAGCEDGTFWSSTGLVTSRTNASGSVILRIAQGDRFSTMKLKIQGKSSSAKDVYVNYRNSYTNGKAKEDPTESFENAAIPLSEDNTFEICCSADSLESTAVHKFVI